MDATYPNPVFEGSEKRIEICFSSASSAPSDGLRSLPREQLDELMTLAACCIVSNRSNEHLDAYVLSESSLFVYPAKWVLKTCGTTRLLNAVPRLLEIAASIGMTPRRCKFSRASFLFPEEQVGGVSRASIRVSGGLVKTCSLCRTHKLRPVFISLPPPPSSPTPSLPPFPSPLVFRTLALIHIPFPMTPNLSIHC